VIRQHLSSLAPATRWGVEWQVVRCGARCCQEQIGGSPDDDYREASSMPHLMQVSRSCSLVLAQGGHIRVIPLMTPPSEVERTEHLC